MAHDATILRRVVLSLSADSTDHERRRSDTVRGLMAEGYSKPDLARNMQRAWLFLLPFQLVAIIGAIGLVTGVTAAMVVVLLRGDIQPAPLPGEVIAGAVAPDRPRDRIAPVFTPEVQYWNDHIMRWSREYGVDADILATVIQIESCGHYLVNSPAGAQGLFQVMPFHFSDGEDMLDPDTNARRGINYLIGGLERSDGHIGLAMAGYNGGWGVIPRGWGRWVTETRNYYVWGSQIYMDALAGISSEQSASLQSWLNAGGRRLCNMAAIVLGLAGPTSTPSPAPALPTPAPVLPPAALPTSEPTFVIPPTITPRP